MAHYLSIIFYESPMPLTFASAELVALCCESVLYGMYLVMFLEHIEVIFNKERRRVMGTSLCLVLVTSALFALVTLHQIIDAIRLYFAYQGSQTNGGADKYYLDVTSTLSLVKTSVYLIETAVSDLFLLYRCYIVWEAKISVLALPVFLYIADIAMGIMAVYTLSSFRASSVFNREQETVSISFFFCTLALNALCSGLIAFRVWKTHKRTIDAKMGADLKGVFIVIIESGAMYTIILAGEVATYATGSYIFNVFLDVISPLIGIVFLFLIVRVRHHIPQDETLPPRSILYSNPSRVTHARSSGSVIFKSTTMMIPITWMDSDGSEPTFEVDTMPDEA